MPAARLFDETLKLFLTGHGTRSLEVLRRRGLLAVLYPGVEDFLQRHPDSAVSMLAAVTGMMRKADELLRSRVSRNVNVEVEEQLTPLQKVADWIAWFSGSMPFLMVNAVWFIVWIVINTVDVGLSRFDPYPFGLLTMIVSLEAIFLSCFVLVSQNRQAEKDRVRADVEYEINVKAELEVAHLHEKTDRMYEQMLARFVALEKEMRSLRLGAIAAAEVVADR